MGIMGIIGAMRTMRCRSPLSFFLLSLSALLSLFSLNYVVRVVALNVYCAERTCWAQVFAGAAADAFGYIYGRNLE